MGRIEVGFAIKTSLDSLVHYCSRIRNNIVAQCQPRTPDTDNVEPDTKESDVETVVRKDYLNFVSSTKGVVDRTGTCKRSKGPPIGSTFVNHYTVKDIRIPRYCYVETVRCGGSILEIYNVGGEAATDLGAIGVGGRWRA
jgi:hypothetical protein